MPEQYTITGTITPANGAERAGIRVQAFDRELPSLERRKGSALLMLGKEATTDEEGRFQITYTLEQFQSGEAISRFRGSSKKNADLSFSVFEDTGQELSINRIEALTLNREYRSDQIIVNAPTPLEVRISVDAPRELDTSEYERLIRLITPVVEDLPLAEITDEDLVFLSNELGLEQQSDTQQHIEWLRRCALLAQETNLPIEAFYGWGRYGWGRKDVPAAFAELATVPMEKLSSVLKDLIALREEILREALVAAIVENIIPVSFRDRMNEIVTQIERLKVGQGLLTARRFIGKLLNERSAEPLVGLTVQAFDLHARQEPKNLGQHVSNNEGVFAFHYLTPPPPVEEGPAQTKYRLRLQVLVNPETQEKFETEVQADGDQDILNIPIPIPAPSEPESHQLTNLAPTLPLEVPPDLLAFLTGKNIHTLADIRKAGGLSHLEGLPVATPVIQLLEAHADLSRISPDVQVNAVMIDKRYNGVAAIAKASRPDFVGTMRDRIGDFKAAQLQVAARAQTDFMHNLMFQKLADQGNGFEVDPRMAEQIRCRCRDCEAAVSPLAYLADLLKYVTEHITLPKDIGIITLFFAPIDATDLAGIFHRPFDLPASCEAVDTQINQVRLCVEVLRSYLGARPLADAAKEERLVETEQDYRLATYTALLAQIGSHYTELRLSRTSEPSVRQLLADRLGIDLRHLNALFLDPKAVPADPKAVPADTLTEAALEQLFGLVDTTRDPLTSAAPAALQTWRLEYLRTLWKSQDFPTDRYEDGQNVVALTQLPADVTFAPPLDAKISYDPDRQQLVCLGEMTADERSTLLAFSPALAYQQAVKQLFQTSQRLPIIDPDLIGPDDFRHPFLKAKPDDPDQAFDLWKKRRDWVDDRLKVFSGLTKLIAVDGKNQEVPDMTAMFTAMYQPVTYDTTRVTAWAHTTPSAEFETLRDQLIQGIDVNVIKFRLQDDLHLTVECFTRLMVIGAKAKAWETDHRNDPVKDDEWREVYSMLVQAQKMKLFAAWRTEESDTEIQLDPHTFWIALRQPHEGEWPPILSAQLPLIDPATLKLTDLPEPIAGERAIALWQARQTRLEQIPKDLATARQNKDPKKGFDAMLKLALGHRTPGKPLQHNLATLKTALSDPDPAVVASATTKITNDLHLTVDNFKRLLALKAKNDDPDLQKKLTAAEWAELFAILTPARKGKHEFPIWIAEEQNALTGVVYWSALKATLPLWRSSGDARQLWQQALRTRSQSPIIDPDLIGPGDLKHPAPGDPAFDLLKAREGAIATQVAQLVAKPHILARLDTNFHAILGVSVAQFLAIAADQEKGHVISERLAQLSLEVAEFHYLLRIANLASQAQPILDLEWANVSAILVQIWKRRQSAKWRAAEKAQHILLSADFFQIPPFVPMQFPPKEPTVVDIWRSPRVAYQDWQDRLQSRLDQEKTVSQALAEAVSAVEEATLPMLRDALILAMTLPGDVEAKAKWVAINLLIDANMSGCSMTTRVAQAIETLQGLILALRAGQRADLHKRMRLNLDHFDEKWEWLGAYASWRAAMFVFLYPENILQPNLRKPEWQTPAWKTLVKNIGANRTLTPTDACEEANKYAEYFQDICTLRVEASCTSRTRLIKGDRCNKTDNGYRCLFYMFGRGGVTGKVYWSAYDFQDGSGYAQTFWTPVKGADDTELKGLENLEGIIGAVPYQTSLNEHCIFLLARKQDALTRKIICATYDLDTPGWHSELLPLDVSAQTEVGFTAVVKQQDFENSPPHLIISSLRAGAFELKMNADGKGWENHAPYPLSTRRVLGMVGIDHNSFYVIDEGSTQELFCTLYVSVEDPRGDKGSRIPNARYTLAAMHLFDRQISTVVVTYEKMVGAYSGAFSLFWAGKAVIYVVTESISPPWEGVFPSSFWQVLYNGSRTLEVSGVKAPITTIEPFRILPTSGLLDDAATKRKRFVYQPDGRPAIELCFLHHLLELYPEGERPVLPRVNGPFTIPIQLSPEALKLRKPLIEKAFSYNATPVLSNLTYLEEAYYFVPIHLALALQRSGEYYAALALLRTVYDYTADVSQRKIYYGLVAEELSAHNYIRGKDWLLDPLNPHAIASTRQNTYTRFTLLAIIRCLLDAADAEFTQDTPESNPRARRLYLTALELFEAPELTQSLNKCDEIIGILDDIPIPDDRWQIHVQQIKGELKVIPHLHKLQPVVDQIRRALMTNASVEQRFVDARAILHHAIAALPPAPNLTTVMQENENVRHAVQRSALADSSLATALESISTSATEDFQRTVAMVTGISPARLALRSVDLPWLREPVPLAGNPQEVQPGAHPAIVRHDGAQLDVLAPTYMATLAQIAARQPMNALHLFVPMKAVHIPQLIVGFCIPPNPLLKTLRLRAELNLYKLRTCRNIAGLQRQLESYAAPTDTLTGLPTIGAGGQLLLPGVVRLQPTLYRYPVLIERAKQLVQFAGQIEAAMFSTLLQRGLEAYNLFKARQELNLAQASVQLQSLRVTEANHGVTLAELQKRHAEEQETAYHTLVESRLSKSAFSR